MPKTKKRSEHIDHSEGLCEVCENYGRCRACGRGYQNVAVKKKLIVKSFLKLQMEINSKVKNDLYSKISDEIHWKLESKLHSKLDWKISAKLRDQLHWNIHAKLREELRQR